MTKRTDETDEEYRARHREEERARRKTEEWKAKQREYKQRPEAKARHAALERERRKTKQVKAYDREYRRKYRDEHREKVREYGREFQRKRRAALKAAGLRDPNYPGPEKQREYYLKWERKNPRHTMVSRAKHTAKQRGIEFAITVDDLTWPTHCPVLGIELCYDRDKKTPQRDNYPTLDRWDNDKGYVPGNVFVISWRANRLKFNMTAEQLELLVRYAKQKPEAG